MTHGTPEQIEADIERQRADLADTVSALQSRLDVKAHAKDRAEQVRDRVHDEMTTDDGRLRRAAVAGGAAGAAATIAGSVALARGREASPGPVRSVLGLLAAGAVGSVLGTVAGTIASKKVGDGRGAHAAAPS